MLKRKIPQQKLSTKDKYYTALGLTNLDSIAVMFGVIFSGKICHPLTETGLNISVDVVGNMDDRDYFRSNNGFGRHFPGDLNCKYKGKTIPCLCQWSERDGITTKILVDILSELDTLHIFDTDRGKGVNPFLLFDGHISRFEIPFLRYIYDKEYEWAVVIGGPYDTVLWQVWDSVEHNVCFNMASVDIKNNL